MIQYWLKNSKNILRSGYLWNMVAASVTAGQSAVIMIFITRMLGTERAGIFGIAYAYALLLSTFSKYGIRNYQVTDIKEKYTYGEYIVGRAISISVALVAMSVYLTIQFYNGRYGLYKILIIAFICIWKQTDSIEDVIYGMYQQKGRFDIASKCFFLRQFFSTVIFCVLTLVHMDLLISCGLTAFTSVLCMLFLVGITRTTFQVNHVFTIKRSFQMLIDCIALCISGTISNYVCNAPKYTVDRCMDDVSQAYFGYIMMPAYMIVMFSSFFFTPLLKDIGEMVYCGKKKALGHCFFRQSVIILFLTSVGILAAYVAGIPVLSAIYGIELDAFKKEMLLLVFGAGVYALLVFITVLLTALRKQNYIAGIYIIGIILFYFLGEYFAKKSGIFGVAITYLGVNMFMVVLLGLIFWVNFITLREKNDKLSCSN